MPERQHRIDQLVEAALELDETQRRQFLKQNCAGDDGLRLEVESLLAFGKDAENFLEAPPLEIAAEALAKEQSALQACKHGSNRGLEGQTISHYRVLSRLGSGGMGVVYEAQDIRLGRRVALKFLPETMAQDETALQRFEREARAASSLNHPGICTIYEVEEHDHQPVIVMELLEGKSLKERIREGPVSTDEVLEFGTQAADALEAAHAKGIIHRDIKPGNIFIVSSGRVKILDFGLAKVRTAGAAENEVGEVEVEDDSLTQEGVIPGTTPYMSPEQAQGEEIDARSDLFSLGVVLYELATGQRPFARNNRTLTIDAILHAHPSAPRSLNPALPGALDAIITRALEKDRDLRYQHAAEVRADLQQLKRHTEFHESAIVARNRRVLWVAAAVLVIVAAVFVGYFSFRRPAKLTEKDTVVLADFTNTTGDPVFDDTLKTALTVSLRQSPFLNVLSDDKVAETLRLMARPTSAPLTLEITREVCQRAGSKAYIAGSIVELGSQYVLALKAVNCQGGQTLGQEQVTAAAKETILGALSEAASHLRRQLGESLATVQKFDVPLAQATTSSLEALKAYSLGEKAHREIGTAAALPYHQRAIELDPSFAIGYQGVGDDYYVLGEDGRASEYFTKAFRLREHASDREKLAITADYYSSVTGEQEKAAQTYQEAIQTYPQDYRLHLDLGTVYSFEGQHEKARRAYSESLRLVPDNAGASSDLVNSLLALQRFDEARRILQEAEAKRVDNFIHHNALYALSFLASDFQTMEAQRQWFTETPEENFGLSLASDSEAYAGHLRKARELTKQSVASAIHSDSKETGAIWQEIAAQREAAFGNAMNAKQEAADGLKLAPASPGAAAEAALAFAIAGDAARAESLAQDLNKRFPLDTQMQSLWLPAIQAQLALNRNNPALALNALKAASPIELGQIPFVNNLSCLYPAYVRGEAFLASAQGGAAAAEFQKILDHSGLVWNCWTGALAHLGVARANALQAKTSQGADADAARLRALAAYKDFLTLWKDADPDIPILMQTKAEYAKRVLSSTSSRRVKVPLAPK
ncbi:MAG: serine/threonine-protein kinase [Candidatus Sulfotelmatobacter sp.]